MKVNIEEHLGLARKVAHNFSKRNGSKYTYEELESQAFLGLVKAAYKFEPERGLRFSTFAIPIIQYELLRIFRDDKWFFSSRGCPHDIGSLNIRVGSKNKDEEIQNLLKEDKDYETEIINNLLVKNLTKNLTDEEKELIYLYYYRVLNQQEIAEMFDLSQTTISRKLRRIINKMRDELNNKSVELCII